MMRRIVQNSNEHSLMSKQILKSHDFSCTAYSRGKLIIRPSFTKIASNPLHFYNVFKGIFMGQFTHLVDLFVILWF